MPRTRHKLFKDEINPAVVVRIGAALAAFQPGFPEDAFAADGRRGLAGLEMKDRVRHVMAALSRHLPDDFPQALEAVRQAALLLDEDGQPLLSGFAAWPLIDWVGEYGLDHPDLSLEALRRMTHRFSAEFAIRPFLLQHSESTLATLRTWIDDDDHHVRRLISEGTRPRLPWGRRLPMFMDDPAPVLALLESLKDDPEEYVRRSVANNLNDIAKDHSDLVAEVGARWMKGAGRARQRLVRHGLRTLVKQGHESALKALGYNTRPGVKVELSLENDALRVGQSLNLDIQITSTRRRAQKLVVDFAVYFRKSDGSLAPRIFKWKVVDLPSGGHVRLRKKHMMVPRSVRPLYPGRHEVALLVAGREFSRRAFLLKS